RTGILPRPAPIQPGDAAPDRADEQGSALAPVNLERHHHGRDRAGGRGGDHREGPVQVANQGRALVQRLHCPPLAGRRRRARGTSVSQPSRSERARMSPMISAIVTFSSLEALISFSSASTRRFSPVTVAFKTP